MLSCFASHLELFGRGLYDSVRNAFDVVKIDDLNTESSAQPKRTQHPHQPRSKNSSSKTSHIQRIKSNLALLCLFNGGILLCGMVCFHYVFLPTFCRFFYMLAGLDPSVSSQSLLFIQHILTYTFNFLWLIPAFIISKFVNSYWFRDIADAIFKKLTKRTPKLRPLSLAESIADPTFSIIMQLFFLIQSTIILLIPIPVLSTLLGYMCLCLLYSFYAFEYSWMYANHDIKTRIQRIESNWPYFLGFGLPLTILSTQLCKSVIINECIFSILFPFTIVAATSVRYSERTKLEPTQHKIIPLSVFKICIYLTNRLPDLIRRKKLSKPQTADQ